MNEDVRDIPFRYIGKAIRCIVRDDWSGELADEQVLAVADCLAMLRDYGLFWRDIPTLVGIERWQMDYLRAEIRRHLVEKGFRKQTAEVAP